ncbi:hypothetical protein [Roseibium sediminicola]|uniref:Uncharacterized protein n=1 Tax=Roseibium sediminicola TaxID=2933272 RepID=A0ABT0GNG3_9HYPH|nr:hypothetical protein [Roseibium sp. CAU 1639]MCK7610956.1 hypothetical protein [Roseibium sp. CAU 1639]
MNSQAFGEQGSVRYPLRRRRQQPPYRRHQPVAMRQIQVRRGPKPVNWGHRMLIAFAGFLCGLAADSLVMFAEHHFHLAKDRDPDLFALVLGTGFAGHALYLIFAALAVSLLVAFNRRKWILWLLLGFAGGLISI